MGRWLIVAGLVLVAVGATLHYAPWLLNWFGRLPGDIDIQRGRTRVFIPITSMILLSVVITVLLNLVRR
jgi:H+/Cl- antiporter ClcA